jgi:hypothetical protein
MLAPALVGSCCSILHEFRTLAGADIQDLAQPRYQMTRRHPLSRSLVPTAGSGRPCPVKERLFPTEANGMVALSATASKCKVEIFGSGITRIRGHKNIKDEGLLKIMLWTFRIGEMRFRYPAKLTIVIHSSRIDQINLLDIKSAKNGV